MLCWSLQRSCTTEPVTAELGISQDGVWGGTRLKEEERIRHAYEKHCDSFSITRVLRRTQDFERHVGLAEADRVKRSADLAAVLPGVLLSHPMQRHRGPFDARPAFKGT